MDESSSVESIVKLVESWIESPESDEAGGKTFWSGVLSASCGTQADTLAVSTSNAAAVLANGVAGTSNAEFKCSIKSLVSERKRREKLGKLLCALSALVPNITKTDKASILSNAISYIKQLQIKVQQLEEKATQPIQLEVYLIEDHTYMLRINCVSQDFTNICNALIAMDLDIVSASMVNLQGRRFSTFMVKAQDWNELSTNQIKQLVYQQVNEK